MHFRPDINGLRAIAVLTVVLFHFEVPGFQGGFVGVDVFFVISGYLMTGIIFTKIDKGSFHIIGCPRYWVKQLLKDLFQSGRYFISGNSYQAVSLLISIATESGRKVEWRQINK